VEEQSGEVRRNFRIAPLLSFGAPRLQEQIFQNVFAQLNWYGIYPIANHRLPGYTYLRQPFEPIAQWVRGLGAIMG
jgi:hypothetical protein